MSDWIINIIFPAAIIAAVVLGAIAGKALADETFGPRKKDPRP